jgi:hypothetical protein
VGKDDWCVGLTTLPPSCADYLEIWEPQLPGILLAPSRPIMGLIYLYISKYPASSLKISNCRMLFSEIHRFVDAVNHNNTQKLYPVLFFKFTSFFKEQNATKINC